MVWLIGGFIAAGFLLILSSLILLMQCRPVRLMDIAAAGVGLALIILAMVIWGSADYV